MIPIGLDDRIDPWHNRDLVVHSIFHEWPGAYMTIMCHRQVLVELFQRFHWKREIACIHRNDVVSEKAFFFDGVCDVFVERHDSSRLEGLLSLQKAERPEIPLDGSYSAVDRAIEATRRIEK
jgi:hypothetical protein